MIDFIRGVLVTFLSCLLAFFAPVQDFLVSMFCLFVANVAFGVLADYVNGGEWQKRKFFVFFRDCLVFFGLIVAFFVIGYFAHRREEAATCVSVTCLLAIWAFGLNILRNCKECCLKTSSMYKLFDILYFIVSAQVIKKVPFVAEYIKSKEVENENINK
ncbi:phage holin family protein [Prevotella pallens]|uniref:phage holin family protein n=1 Tax=Prevotella pallens TaxID=60133 RepID=UPI0028ECF92D|nr:phage holin family protein [Prevotella pallens]